MDAILVSGCPSPLIDILSLWAYSATSIPITSIPWSCFHHDFLVGNQDGIHMLYSEIKRLDKGIETKCLKHTPKTRWKQYWTILVNVYYVAEYIERFKKLIQCQGHAETKMASMCSPVKLNALWKTWGQNVWADTKIQDENKIEASWLLFSMLLNMVKGFKNR